MDLAVGGLYYLCFTVLIGLGILVLKKNPRARLNQYFFFFALSLLGWLVSLYFFNRHLDTPGLTVVGRINLAFAAIAVMYGYLFLPAVAKKSSPRSKLLFIETAALSAITVGTGLIDKSEHIKDGQHITVFGPLYIFYVIHLAGYILSALNFTFYRGKLIGGKVKHQLSIIGSGILVTGTIAVVTTSLLPYVFDIFKLQEIGALSTTFLLGTIAYAILAHQLFDIRVIVKRTVVYSVLLASALAIYSTVIFFFTSFFGSNGSSAFEARNFITNIVAAGLIAIGFDPLRRWLEEKTDSFLFKKEYEQQVVLSDLTKHLNDVLALDEALEIMMQTIVKVLHLRHAATFVFQNGENGNAVVKRVKQIGYSSMNSLYLNEHDFVVEYFSKHPGIITRQDIALKLAEQESHYNYIAKRPPKNIPAETSEIIREHAVLEAVAKKLKVLDVDLAAPLHLGEGPNAHPLGLILLSDKRSGDGFSAEDLKLMATIGEQAISAIQKAKLFEGDQMKSEFVSIASHELLTPISAIEGYLSMILDEHIGKVDPTAEEYLGKVYTSAKRLAALVKDLLSVSRIESGKMEFAQQQLDMPKMIQDTLDQLKFVAREKGLTVTFEKPAKKLPPVWADPDRTMQVLVNLVSNAIKYTPTGSVTLTAHQISSPPSIRVDVTDTGLGISHEAVSHLFQKFYRVDTPETTGIIGTGLGLYITKTIVERMGGTMRVKSAVGKGSTFSFSLPLFKIETSERSPEN